MGRKREDQVDVVGPEAVVPKGGLASLCGWLGDMEENMGRSFFLTLRWRVCGILLKSIAFRSGGSSNPQKASPLKQPWQTNSSLFQSRDMNPTPGI